MQNVTIKGTQGNYDELLATLSDELINAMERLNNTYVKNIDLHISYAYGNWAEHTYTITFIKTK